MCESRPHTLARITEAFPAFSIGAAVILLLAVASGAVLAVLPVRSPGEIRFWTFTRMHAAIYASELERWNAAHPDASVEMTVFALPALERRTMSSFLAKTTPRFVGR